MSGTTTNNGWTYPSGTDLAKLGASDIQTLAQGIDTSTGKGLIAWQSYTPTIGGTGWVLNNGTVAGAYCQIGKTVHFVARVTFGSTSTFGAGRPTVSLPVSASTSAANTDFVTNIAFYDSSATARYLGTCDFTTTYVDLFCWNSAGTYVVSAGVTSSAPMTWATSDQIFVSGTYEAA